MTISGNLKIFRQEGGKKGWFPRYFELQGDQLVYRENASAKAGRRIRLEGSTVEQDRPAKFMFVVKTAAKGNFHIRCANEDELNKWFKAVSAAVNGGAPDEEEEEYVTDVGEYNPGSDEEDDFFDEDDEDDWE